MFSRRVAKGAKKEIVLFKSLRTLHPRGKKFFQV